MLSLVWSVLGGGVDHLSTDGSGKTHERHFLKAKERTRVKDGVVEVGVLGERERGRVRERIDFAAASYS